jgi:molybdate transport system permease protein
MKGGFIRTTMPNNRVEHNTGRLQPLCAPAPWDTFWSVAVPLARPGFITGAILGFAHTVGEFGIVLMIGGSIPGKTRVVSVQIYDHVEALEYAQAHWLAGGMVLFSFLVLVALYIFNPPGRKSE